MSTILHKLVHIVPATDANMEHAPPVHAAADVCTADR